MPQTQIDQQPVTQITIVEAEPERQTEALSLMKKRAHFVQGQPGFISISLHRSLDGRRIVNYIQWQSRDLLRAAHQSPDFREAWSQSEGLTDYIDAHLYEVTEILPDKQ